MKNNKNKIKTGIIVAILMICLCGCNGNEKRENAKEATQMCTLFVTCENAVNSDKLSNEMRKELSKDGIVYAKKEIAYTQGETAFDVLQRELKREKVMLESSVTPGTKSVYIEGISNLYEFDCGELSGWMYTINGEEMGVSCSDYELKDGDEITFQYTLNMGEDISKKRE